MHWATVVVAQVVLVATVDMAEKMDRAAGMMDLLSRTTNMSQHWAIWMTATDDMESLRSIQKALTITSSPIAIPTFPGDTKARPMKASSVMVPAGVEVPVVADQVVPPGAAQTMAL